MEIKPIGKNKIVIEPVYIRGHEITEVEELLDVIMDIPTFPFTLTADDGTKYTLTSIKKEDSTYCPVLMYKDKVEELDLPAEMVVSERCGRRSTSYNSLFRRDVYERQNQELKGTSDLLNIRRYQWNSNIVRH